MRMSQPGLLATLLVGATMTANTEAASVLTEWGTVATISNAGCADACNPSVLDPLSAFTNLVVDPIVGGVGQASASTAVGAYPTPGSASAAAVTSGTLALPTLTAAAASGAGTWIAGQALAIQGYTYTGLVNDTIDLNFTLTGSVTNPDLDSTTGLVALVSLITPAALGGFPTIEDPNTTIAALTLLALLSADDYDLVEGHDGAVNLPGSVSIAVAPGDSFYLMMTLMAGAAGTGGSAESLSTLVATFEAGAELVLTPASATAVPLPPALGLFGAALGLLGARGWRRRGRQAPTHA